MGWNTAEVGDSYVYDTERRDEFLNYLPFAAAVGLTGIDGVLRFSALVLLVGLTAGSGSRHSVYFPTLAHLLASD